MCDEGLRELLGGSTGGEGRGHDGGVAEMTVVGTAGGDGEGSGWRWWLMLTAAAAVVVSERKGGGRAEGEAAWRRGVAERSGEWRLVVRLPRRS